MNAATLHPAPRQRHPARELLARYRAVFSAAWAHRNELAGPKLLTDEAAFLPAALSLQHTPVHPAPRRIAYVLIALFLIALLWACIGKVDIVAVAPGRIIVGERTKVVQPLENSVVNAILVRDGDKVHAGQALIELDPTSASADKVSVQEALKAAQSESIRTRSLLAWLSQPPSQSTVPATLAFPDTWSPEDRRAVHAQLDAERSDINARLARFAAEIHRRQAETTTAKEVVAKLEATLPLAKQREEDFKNLTAQGFMASHAGQDRTRERIELERDLNTQRARLQESLANQAESESTRTAYLAETKRTLWDREAQAELKRQQATQEHAKARQREKLTTLTAPVSGTVQQLAVHTAGGVVTEAQPLMVIVPDDTNTEVVAEVTLENKDIGFVQPGQEVEVKLETFSFTRYVDAIDPKNGLRYRYAGRVEEPWQTNKSYLQGYTRFVLDKTPSPGPIPRYGVTYDDISTREEREYWIAGSSLKVVDLQTKEVIAERIGYMVDWAQGSQIGGRSPWLFAAENACPSFQRNPLAPTPHPAFPAQAAQTLDFVEKILQPTK